MYTNKSSIEKTIENLLHRHECVILPDFGGFIVRDSPCNFNASKDVLKPFAKHIFFNPHLTQNDGLLVNEIQKLENLNYTEALEYCKNAIDQVRNEIENNGQKSFGKLGSFHQGQSSIWFSPNTSLNLSVESYGLVSVDLIEVKTPQVQNTSHSDILSEKLTETLADQTPIVSLDVPKRGLKPWLVAASFALLAHFIYLGLESKTARIQEASVLPHIEVQAPDSESISSIETAIDSNTLNTQAAVITEITEPQVEEVIQTTPEPIVIDQPVSNLNTVEVPTITEQVIAKYRLEGNANFHAADLNKKGQSAQVVRRGNWFEVLSPQ